MGLGHSPRIVTDGLVLALDAGNPKNYNAGISTNWTDKVGGNNGTLVSGTYHTDGPFVGAGYVEFDGTDDYLSLADSADLRLGTGTFTIEAWIYPHTVSPTFNSSIVVKGLSSAAATWQFDISNSSKLRFQYDASSSISSSSSLVANVWTHVAVVREGTGTNETKLYINGVLDTTGTVASDFSTTDTMKIGRNRGGGADTYYNGYISNVRILKGTALYTSNFTPPSRTLTAVPNTVLLTCQGNTIADASVGIHTITANGDISLTKEPFGGAGAVDFGGSADGLYTPNITLGSNDWTLEFWIYLTSTGTDRGLYSYFLGDTSDRSISCYIDSSNQIVLRHRINDGTYPTATGSTALSAHTWYHVAAVRVNDDYYIYINGVQDASYTSAPAGHTYYADGVPHYIGYNRNATSDFDGLLSNVRLVNGTALYTSNFTPPAEPLTAVTNTELLTCQGQNIKDASSNAHTITVNGDAKATIVSSAFEFDGTDDYITTNTNANFTLGASEDFALEWWEYWTLTSPTAMHGHVGVFDNGCLHIASYTGSQQFAMHYGTWRYFANAYVVPFKWTHYVVTGQSQNIRFYQNGELKSTNTGTAYTVSGTPGATKYFEVGRNTYISTKYSKMKASSVKFYKGKSLSTAEVTQNYNALKGRYA